MLCSFFVFVFSSLHSLLSIDPSGTQNLQKKRGAVRIHAMLLSDIPSDVVSITMTSA